MADFKVNIDTSALTNFLEKFAKDVQKDIAKGVKGLAMSAHSHILEQAKEKLDKWDRPRYESNLSQAEQIDDLIWEITLGPDAANIEEGRDAWDMKGEPGKWGLLKNSDTVKNGPNAGKHYKVIPMTQGKESKTMDTAKIARQEMLVANIKSFLKSKNISKSKIETETAVGRKTGQSITRHKIGLIHGPFDIESGEPPGAGNTPQLQRLYVNQQQNARGTTKRTLTTFRTAVEGDGKWIHKGVEAKNIFPSTAQWAENEWNNVWMPKILEKWGR